MRLILLTLLYTGLAYSSACAQSPADTTLAHEYYQTADSLSEQGKYEEANALFRQAQVIYQAAENWEKYIACLNSVAYNLWPIAAYDSATAVAQQALQLSEQYLGANHPEVARTYDVLGIVQEYDGEYSEALTYYQQALQIRKQHYLENHSDIANSYENLGLVYEELGKYDQALLYHFKVLAIRKKLYPEGHLSLADTYNNIGMTQEKEGAYNIALSFCQQALIIRKKILGKAHPDIADSYSSIGIIYEKSGAYDQALKFHQRALTIEEELFGENHPNVAGIYSHIGRVYEKKGAYNQALRFQLKALSIHQKLFEEIHPYIASDYHNIGAVYKKKGLYDKALYYYKKALLVDQELFGKVNPYSVVTLINIGNLQSKQQAYLSSLDYYQQSLVANGVVFENHSVYANPTLKHCLNRNDLFFTLKLKAEVLYTINLDALAYATYLLADSLLDQIHHSYQLQSDKIFLAHTAKQLYEGAIKTALKRYHIKQDAQYYQKAFYFSEKSKAGVLAEVLSASEAKQFGQVPDSLIALETSLKEDRSFYQSQLASADSSLHQSKLFAVNRRYDSLMQMLEAKFPDYYQLKYAARTVTVPNIQSQLSPDEAVVSYFIGDSTQYAFTITATQFQATTLPQDSLLDRRVQTLRRTIKLDSTSRTEYQQQAYALYQQLLAPVVADSLLTGIRRLTVIPDGALGYLPFELLLTQPASADTEYAALPYLMRDYTVRYGYSATWLFHPFSRSARPTQDQYIAFAPSYPASVSDSTQQLALGRFRDQVSPLRFNGQEANNIQQYLSGVALTDKEAVERRFKEEANQYRIIHLAMHALVDDENPMYSRLVFTPDATDTLEDGYLNAYELYNMELSADLAVLSACETGYGKLEQGEGIMSLARAFAYAGCPSIVMSHWTVEDAASAQLMNHFYRYLSEGLPKDEALRQAKLAYLETASLQDTHPFFWGNFVVIGDTAPIVVPRPVWQYWLIGGGFLLAVGLVILFLQRYLFGRRYHKGA